MIALELSTRFKKRYRKLEKSLQQKVDNCLVLFSHAPFHPLLENHQLTGALKKLRSISVTGDYRIWYEVAGPHAVRMVRLGTHAELYKK